MKQRKRPKSKRVAPTRLIDTTTEIFNPIINKPGLKNMVLTIIVIALCPKFKINEISRHLPVSVETEKTKQKRLLRFIDSEFPKKEVLDRWARFVLETVYQTSGGVVPILIDETALIGPFQAIVAAVPFRQRAIVIYFKVYTNKEIQSMKIVSHNVLVQQFCWRVSKITTSWLPKKSKPLLIFDRGFARAEHIMQWLMRRKIPFLIRVCKNTGLEFEGNVTTLNQLDRTGFYPRVVYHRTLKLRLNLYVARDNSFDDPMYLVTNCVTGLTIYLCYKRRMQIEHGFRDLKTTFGFRHLRLIKETKKRVELLWLLLCITCGLLMLQYEKSGYRWSGFYCSGSKTKSLIWVIKTELSKLWKQFLLNPFFTLPLFDGDIVQLC